MLLLLSAAFVATVVACVLNAVVVHANERRLDDLRRVAATAPEQVIAWQEHATATAQKVAGFQGATLALMVLAFALITAAAWLHFQTAPIAGRWVTVCAWTRRVHWQGRWLTFEDYLAQRFNLHCTHGICDEEAEKLCRESPSTLDARGELPRG